MSAVKVLCRFASGLVLRAGEKAVTLAYGVNDVDSAFWATWTAENAEFPALRSGLLLVLGGDSPTAAEPPPQPAMVHEPERPSPVQLESAIETLQAELAADKGGA